MAEEKESIVMFPFMAQGHIIPFLALALQLEQRGYNIVFVNTPLNIDKLRQSIPPSSAIQLREIPFDASAHGLPPGVENTDALSYALVFPFVVATLSLKPAFKSLLSDLIRSGAPPLCVIADMFFGWSAEVAHELGIFHAIFSCSGGYGMGCFYSIWLNLPHRSSGSDEFTLPDFREAGLFHVTQMTPACFAADGEDQYSIFQRQNLPSWANSDGLLLNSVAEFDELGVAYFRRKLKKPIWPIGPILLSGDKRSRAHKKAGITMEQSIDWLDSKPPNSVLYISFGSMNTISPSQMMELAKALEVTGINFMWVVRPPLGFDINSEFRADEWLPEGFIRRTVEEERRGLLVEQWAPQVEILSHKSVGAFLSHCGWNSVLEALSRGVPLVGWPMAAEQFYNSKWLEEEAGVCLELGRGASIEVRHEDLAEKMQTVMSESEKGKEMKRKAGEMKDMIRNAIRDEEGFKGSSVKALDEFLDAALLSEETKKVGE